MAMGMICINYLACGEVHVCSYSVVAENLLM